MHLFHPLLPLTHAGRVLLAAAVAVFAALLLVAWTPAGEAEAAPLTSADVVH